MQSHAWCEKVWFGDVSRIPTPTGLGREHCRKQKYKKPFMQPNPCPLPTPHQSRVGHQPIPPHHPPAATSGGVHDSVFMTP